MGILGKLRKQYQDLARKIAKQEQLTHEEQLSFNRLYADPAFKELVARIKAAL